MAGLLFCEQLCILATGLVRHTLYVAPGKALYRRWKASYGACRAVVGAVAQLRVIYAIFEDIVLAINTEFHVELPLLRLG
jgi:hypothetical protein